MAVRNRHDPYAVVVHYVVDLIHIQANGLFLEIPDTSVLGIFALIAVFRPPVLSFSCVSPLPLPFALLFL